MSRRGLGAQVALLATAMLAACGGGEEDKGSGISMDDVEQAGLDYARCMREHGIDVPDPQPGTGGLRSIFENEERRNDPAFQKAESECDKHVQKLVSEIDEDQRRELENTRLEFARCMRAKDFDVPDPRTALPHDGSGQGGALGDLELNDPRVQQAMEACAQQVPGPRLSE
jgi:hypothetical protein